MNILIIGGCGYIGSALFSNLKLKYNIDTLDLEWFGNFSNHKNIKLDYRNLKESDLQKYDAVILLAAHSSVKMCSGNFSYAFSNNVSNFISLLSKIGNMSKRIKLIYASSSSVYGNTKSKIALENEVNFYPHNNYDIVKYMADLAAERHNIEYYGLRFGTVNGYSPAMRDDIMINSMISSAKKNNCIRLYGGSTYRPILGINDLCLAVSKILDNSKDFRGFYNLASFNTTAKEVAGVVSKIMNIPVNEVEDPTNTSVYSFSISTKKFEETFDFKFKDTVDSICSGIINNYDSINLTNRAYSINYEL